MSGTGSGNCLPPNQDDIRGIEMANREILLERFEEKYIPEPNSGCWLWTAAVDSGGYGTFWINGTTVGAHRSSWILLVGEIPEGMHVLHRCDTRCCVNPSHLWLGSNKDNVDDRERKGRNKIPGLRGENHGMSRLNERVVMEIYNATGSQSEIGKRFGVHQTTVCNIKTRKRWAHIHV